MNLKQLSDLLGLSQTTISRALNGYPEVSAKTRARVVEAARTHGYVPNSMARRLATGRAMAIAHVMPVSEREMVNPVFADFIAGAGETYAQSGYKMVISVVREEDEERAYRDLAAEQSVDGVIVHGPRNQDPRIPLLNRLKLPFVVHGRMETEWPYSWLDINNQTAFRQATEHLIGLGHRRIALLNGPRNLHFAQRREAGYLGAHQAHGLPVDGDLIFSSDMTEPYGYSRTRALLAGPAAPTAILTAGLISALGARRAIYEAGLRLGQDVSVMTFDDALSFLPNTGDVPEFTAMRSSVRAAGKRLSRMLIDQIEGKLSPDATELWEAALVIGASTGPAPVQAENLGGALR